MNYSDGLIDLLVKGLACLESMLLNMAVKYCIDKSMVLKQQRDLCLQLPLSVPQFHLGSILCDNY